MATPLTASKALAQFKKFKLDVVETDGWRDRNRNHKGKWGPANGVMLHHTVTRGTAASLRVLTEGYAGLPGPLCHAMIDKDGTFYLIGWGRANHAGLGDSRVLDAVAREVAIPGARNSDTDGNPRFYGFECVNMGDGKDPWPEAQVDAMCRASAALCAAHGWGAGSVIGHLEWQPGKIDPRGLSMPWMRDRISGLITSGATPPPKKPVVDLSKVREAAKDNPPRSGNKVTYAGVKTVEQALADEGLLAKSLVDGHYGTTTLTAYTKWQKRLGYKGADADGVPGMDSLKKLGAKWGFTVTP